MICEIEGGRYRVALTGEEWALCEYMGGRRQEAALARGYRSRFKGVADDRANHILAYGAELAVAKLLDIYKGESGTPDYDGDVGEGVQVRWTKYAQGHLVVRESDRDDHVFVFVTGGVKADYTIVGWLRAARCRQERYWRSDVPLPGFFVPQSALRALTELQVIGPRSPLRITF